MPTVNLRYTPALEASLSSFSAAGNPGVARLTPGVTVPLPGTGTSVNKITAVPSPETAAALPDELDFSTGIQNAILATLTVERPLGGSSYAPISKLRGVEIILEADPLSTEEVETGNPEDRQTWLSVSLVNSTAGIYLENLTLKVNAPGQADGFCKIFPNALPDDVILVIVANSFAPRTRIKILTASES